MTAIVEKLTLYWQYYPFVRYALIFGVLSAAQYGFDVTVSIENGTVPGELTVTLDVPAGLTSMLKDPSREQAFRRLSECGILEVVLPEIEALHGVEQP